MCQVEGSAILASSFHGWRFKFRDKVDMGHWKIRSDICMRLALEKL